MSLKHLYILAVTLGLVAGGCKSTSKDDGKAPPTTQPSRLGATAASRTKKLPRIHRQYEETPLRVQQQPVAVAQGPAPLVHIFDIGCPIRVVDLTDNSQLATATVPDQTLVTIDARRGVMVGRDNVAPGPLPEGHRFAIYVDPTTDNVFRREIGTPPRLDR